MLNQIVTLTKKLINCPSISPYDAGCQDILINYLDELNFSIEIFNIKDTKNFWAYCHNNANINIVDTLIFAGHTDVVPPGDITKWKSDPFQAIIKNNILYGRGSIDMKGALAAMIMAAKEFFNKYSNYYNGRLAFLITSDEESTAANGTKKVINKLIDRNEKLDYFIIGEPTSNKILGDNIKNGRRGSLNIELIVKGIQGHVAYHKLANNPIHQIVPALNELLLVQWDKGNKFFPKTSMQITHMLSSIKSNINNIIPNNILLKFNFRFNNEIHYKKILDIFNKIIQKHIKYFNIKWNISGLPFLSLPQTNNLNKKNLMNIVKKNIKLINNIYPTIFNDGGTSDARFIIKSKAQIIELGLINSTIHKINECVKINDLYLLSKIYYKIIKDILLKN
ncbi:succinyl-diaminopimelate desuccinylase [Enterobacteriaceae endosymbiont of Plateumaris consimilis]|uniref:succinyl-diaminopimelate desuccinylase n=1 Tax=Enterobacteriaceae endosymbiont of Plateumaris consimilis TaxID=2675794 RepID=UPI00144942D5|nr:succinyl-diaminopimelate desuccinylase [Enterobacteriaceae endosymbiont of Plateumaris consimilis]QJC28625.1 succinyl-diaminopimelate desuccinylase [Enterobacteriaceae endosymbiont of Plateumaris consimilis]